MTADEARALAQALMVEACPGTTVAVEAVEYGQTSAVTGEAEWALRFVRFGHRGLRVRPGVRRIGAGEVDEAWVRGVCERAARTVRSA